MYIELSESLIPKVKVSLNHIVIIVLGNSGAFPTTDLYSTVKENTFDYHKILRL